ncbi:tetratricopeptide repeat protein [Croceibacterium sp. LX-88]|uniref:Tetratricopeptide repeat protein n=1 Tax=Croceibacterium selenioxidans TaxID=2838833 RepID=A0ABS5W2V1_9SPHN|nr:tetratricopeptide repeat protein [Croceibacterium selenioxidans]MBT2133603.1 tetratricopeptide repeat protein [Croceibacterium selenioxidans]
MACRPDLRVCLVAAAVLAASPAALAAPGRDLVSEAEAALDHGDGAAAELAANRAFEAGIPSARVAAIAGEAELLQGNLSAARKWLEPEDFSPATQERGLRALARLEIEEGDFNAASRAYDRALADGQGSAALWVDVGRFRYRTGQHHLALEAARTALEADGQYPRALEFRGQLVRDSVGPVAALPWFEKGLEQAPDDLSLLGEYAATLAEAGRNADMLRVARRMVDIDPRHPRAYLLQAVLAARAGHAGLARRLIDRTNGAYANTPAAQLLSAIIELRNGSAKLAAEQLETLTRAQPDNGNAAMLLGRALLASGDAEGVVARLGPAAERADASPYLLALVGRAYEQMGLRSGAARYLDRAAGPRPALMAVLPVTTGSPTGPEAQSAVRLLRQMLTQGRRAEAIATANRVRQEYAGSADVEVLGGDVALLAGTPGAALAVYSRAAEVRRDFSLVERMVAAQRMLGREQDAKRLLGEYLIHNPRSVPAATLLGRIEAQEGNLPVAVALLSFSNNFSGRQDPLLLADLAEVGARRGDVVLETAQRAYTLQRNNPRITAVLANLFDGDGASQAEANALLAKVQRSAGAAQLAQR